MIDESATELVHRQMPLCARLEIVARVASPDRVVLALDWDETLCTSGSLLHGGAVMTLADSAGGLCAFLNLPEGASGTATIESKTNFMGSTRSGTVEAVATPLHVGGSTIVVETEVRRDDGRLVAKTTETQAVLNIPSGRRR